MQTGELKRPSTWITGTLLTTHVGWIRELGYPSASVPYSTYRLGLQMHPIILPYLIPSLTDNFRMSLTQYSSKRFAYTLVIHGKFSPPSVHQLQDITSLKSQRHPMGNHHDDTKRNSTVGIRSSLLVVFLLIYHTHNLVQKGKLRKKYRPASPRCSHTVPALKPMISAAPWHQPPKLPSVHG